MAPSSVKIWIGCVIAIFLLMFAILAAMHFSRNGQEMGESSSVLSDEPENAVDPHLEEPQFPPRSARQAWFKLAAKEARLVNRPHDLPGDAAYVALTGEYEKWLLGTPVEILIPQTGKRYRSVIDRITPDEFGNTTIQGKPDANETELSSLLLTFNDTQTFAYISTNVGGYELAGSDKGGWITPTRSLQEERDYSQPDVLQTKRDRHATTQYVPPRND